MKNFVFCVHYSTVFAHGLDNLVEVVSRFAWNISKTPQNSSALVWSKRFLLVTTMKNAILMLEENERGKKNLDKKMKSKSFSKGIQSKVNAWRHHKNNNVNYLCMSGMYFRRLLEMFRKKQQIFYFFSKKDNIFVISWQKFVENYLSSRNFMILSKYDTYQFHIVPHS